MSPYREQIQKEQITIDVGKIDVTVTYSGENQTCRNSFIIAGTHTFELKKNSNDIVAVANKPSVKLLLKTYHETGFVSFFQNGITISIPTHRVIDLTFKQGIYNVTIDLKTDALYALIWARAQKYCGVTSKNE